MVKFQTVRQKARIILNSDDAEKTVNTYHTIPIRGDPIRFDGAAGNNIDIINNRIHFMNHGFQEGDAVVYTATTVLTCNPPIANNNTLYIKYVSEHIFQLATSSVGAAIDITAIPGTSAIQTFTRTLTFDGSSAAVVDENCIIFATPHRLETGQEVRYETTGTALKELTKDTTYFVVKYDDNIIQLAATFADATATNADDGTPEAAVLAIEPGTGTTHNLKEIVSLDVNALASPVVDLVNDKINIPGHNLNTGDKVLYEVDASGYGAGTAINGLVDNLEYYIIVRDVNSIQLAMTRDQALAGIPVVNLLNVGTGSNHSFSLVNDTPITTCTNYRFKLQNKPFDLNDKCRLAIQSFEYVRNYNTTKCKSVGGVYFKNILPNDIYSSQGYADGTLLLPAYFVNTFSFQNSDIENTSIPLPSNINNILHNNLDIFIDSKKLNFNNHDIRGCIDDDAWSMTLVIYEIDEYDPINHELDTKLRNYINPRLL